MRNLSRKNGESKKTNRRRTNLRREPNTASTSHTIDRNDQGGASDTEHEMLDHPSSTQVRRTRVCVITSEIQRHQP